MRGIDEPSDCREVSLHALEARLRRLDWTQGGLTDEEKRRLWREVQAREVRSAQTHTGRSACGQGNR